MSFKVKFWGVRGSIACPSVNHVAFGGNTTCLEISAGGRTIILDAGTGIRNLGHWLLRKGVAEATVLMTHTHWDHINGFPFFSPAFHRDRTFRLMAGASRPHGGLRQVMGGQMSHPFFPVPLEAMRAKLEFEDFDAGTTFKLAPDVTIRTAALNHPDGATGYRIEHAGRSMCLITDTEHSPGKPDESVLSLIAGADLVVYDSTYTDAEFPSRVGWGHSTWQEGVRLCRQAGARSLAIFHHDPEHDDRFMSRVETEARAMWPGAFVARENLRIRLD
jgi:phosphoribosyl 1,2-cyclic phosphodiesterase